MRMIVRLRFIVLFTGMTVGHSAAGYEFQSRVVSSNGERAVALAAGDVDGDGDVDVVAVDDGDHIDWYQNLGAPDISFAPHAIDSLLVSSPGDVTVKLIDIDGDTDLDILADARNKIRIFVNDGM